MQETVVPVVIREDYWIAYERVAGITLVHSKVSRWSSGVFRRYLEDIADAHRLLGEPVYVIVPPNTPKLGKFISKFGFNPCGRVLDNLGRVAEIYERTLDGRPIRRWDIHQHNPAELGAVAEPAALPPVGL